MVASGMQTRSPKNIVLTGASSGLGAELAKQLTARGDRLVLMARRVPRLEAVRDEAVAAAKARGATDPFVPLIESVDVSDTATFMAALDRAWDALPGGIDVLLLNAGIGGKFHGKRLDGPRAARVIDVNLTANIHAIARVVPRMVERRQGHVVCVSSLAGYRGMPGGGPYSASKAGLTALCESLRTDLQPFGVAVTVVCPGFVKSEITDSNKFPMPFLLETDDAVRRMIHGIDRRKREVRFPWPLVLMTRLLRALPDPIYDWVARVVLAEQRKG